MIWNVLAVLVCIPTGILLYKEGDKFLAGFNIALGLINLIGIIYQIVV